MDTHKFLELYLRNGSAITHSNMRGWHWRRWYQFADLTKHIDYGCEFKDGKCKGSKQERCCCSNCAYNIGYLNRIPTNWQIIKDIASDFDEELGFWRAEMGCILPRKYRSKVCLLHKCSNLSEAEYSLLEILSGKQPIPGTRAYGRIRDRLLREKEAKNKLKKLELVQTRVFWYDS
jgi:hypothetical protein